MKRLVVILFLLSQLYAQNCSLQIKGRVVDEHDGTSLELASVVLVDQQLAVYTAADGSFELKNICPGSYHLAFSHLSCETKHMYLQLTSDTSIVFMLEHHDELLESVTVLRHKETLNKTAATSSLQGEVLAAKMGENLGTILRSISGVSAVETGAGVSKPMIHGLFGNRVEILQNGVALQSQQWGNEHAPEIDPFSLQKITVVKGAGALKYGTRAMGGAILLENDLMPKDPHVHGKLHMAGFSNGLKMALSASLEGGIQKNPYFSWRVQGSYSKSGDNKAATYFLNNTAREEQALNVQLAYIRNQFNTQVQYSFYRSKLGILRGSHIGNLSDLEEAFQREEPFYTEEKIQFKIDKPFQEVYHNTLKINHLQNLTKGALNLVYAFQANARSEYDIRRSSNQASLALNLLSQEFQSYYSNSKANFKYEIGTQFQSKVNYNSPDLNVKPLIPNYRKQVLALYTIQELKLEKLLFEFGARYEYQNMLVRFYEDQNLINNRHLFNNLALNAGFSTKLKKDFTYRLNLSYVQRAPEINELYSNGLHHGAAAIERGNPNFDKESLWSFNQSFSYLKSDLFFIEISPYFQYFHNYIQLKPQDLLELSIRGAFPVFNYEASKALLWGFDFAMQTQVAKNLYWNLKSAIVRAKDLDAKENISFMPADYLENSLSYDFAFHKKLKELKLNLVGTYTWQQVRAPVFDFTEAPPGNFLLGAQLATKFNFKHLGMQVQLEGQNLLNKSYRNYLNRYRYYADDMGVNLVLRTTLIF